MPKQWSVDQPGILPGQVDEPRLSDLPQVGRVIDVSTAGARFEVLGQSGVLYGPAPWPLGAYASVSSSITAGHYPHVGDVVLVVFAGRGIETPWVVGWTR